MKIIGEFKNLDHARLAANKLVSAFDKENRFLITRKADAAWTLHGYPHIRIGRVGFERFVVFVTGSIVDGTGNKE
jgi:hypothetical protein